MDSDITGSADAETVYIHCAGPNLHHETEAAVDDAYGLTFNEREFIWSP